MKWLIIFLTVIGIFSCKHRDAASFRKDSDPESKNADTAVLITTIDFNELQKDGCIRMNNYIVNIGDERAKHLNGKKVRISGEVTIYDCFEDDRETGNTLDRILVDFSTLWPGSSNQKPANKLKYTEYNMAGSNLYGRSPEDDMAYNLVKQERFGRIKEISDPKIDILK
jgi:hypothetical protein